MHNKKATFWRLRYTFLFRSGGDQHVYSGCTSDFFFWLYGSWSVRTVLLCGAHDGRMARHRAGKNQKNKCSCESVGCSTYRTGHCKSAVQLLHLVTPWLGMKPVGIQMSSPQRAEIWILSSLPQTDVVYSLFVRITSLATEGALSLIFYIYHKRSQTYV